jgi:hypothetical protein
VPTNKKSTRKAKQSKKRRDQIAELQDGVEQLVQRVKELQAELDANYADAGRQILGQLLEDRRPANRHTLVFPSQPTRLVQLTAYATLRFQCGHERDITLEEVEDMVHWRLHVQSIECTHPAHAPIVMRARKD